jgi:hypothetical protein
LFEIVASLAREILYLTWQVRVVSADSVDERFNLSVLPSLFGSALVVVGLKNGVDEVLYRDVVLKADLAMLVSEVDQVEELL